MASWKIATAWFISGREPRALTSCTFRKAKNPVMTLTGFFISKQAEENKHIADSDAVLRKVRLCCTSFAKCAAAVVEHRVFMTKIVASDLAASRTLNDVAQTK
jgi:hypothetical protein